MAARIELLRQSTGGKARAPRRASIGGKWTKEEDDALRRIVEAHGARNWKKVSIHVGIGALD